MDPAFPAAPSGRHVLGELTGCSAELLDHAELLERRLRECASEGGATVVSSHFHRFSPQGVSGVVVIAESHITIHSWPELGYAAVDVFTCGRPEIAEGVMKLIVAALGATAADVTSFDRSPGHIPRRLAPALTL